MHYSNTLLLLSSTLLCSTLTTVNGAHHHGNKLQRLLKLSGKSLANKGSLVTRNGGCPSQLNAMHCCVQEENTMLCCGQVEGTEDCVEIFWYDDVPEKEVGAYVAPAITQTVTAFPSYCTPSQTTASPTFTTVLPYKSYNQPAPWAYTSFNRTTISMAGTNAPSASYLQAPPIIGTGVPSVSLGQANPGILVSKLTAYSLSAQATANGTWTKPPITSNTSVPSLRATPSLASMAGITTPGGFSLMIAVMAITALIIQILI